MGQANCCSPTPQRKQESTNNFLELPQGNIEKIVDTDGNIIDIVMPGLTGILDQINPLQFEHINNQWQVESIQIQPDEQASVDLSSIKQQKVLLTVSKTNDINHSKFLNLTSLDDSSQNAYLKLIEEIEQRQSKRRGSTTSALVKSIVSRNRMRYKDADFNLDLSYITRRVIAMGYPGSGLSGLVRNHVSDVLTYFKKYHKLKIKIYNMCNDKFVNVNILKLETDGDDRKVKLAYFPMMDHNPGPLPIIFKFAIDAILYLASDPENTIAVHCKAGKGRTGLAICAFFIFTEAVTSAEEAVKLFNSRRTTNGKGLGIASQKRYLGYFQKFLQRFKRPYVQIAAAYLHSQKQFDKLLESKNRLKLVSLCFGPFSNCPQQLEVSLKMRDFSIEDLLGKQEISLDQITLQDKSSGVYYLLIIIKNKLVIQDDICVSVSQNAAHSKYPKFNFRFWLNVNYLEPTRKLTEQVNINDLVQLKKQQKECRELMRNNDQFLNLIQSKDKKYVNLQEVQTSVQRMLTKYFRSLQKIQRAISRASQILVCEADEDDQQGIPGSLTEILQQSEQLQAITTLKNEIIHKTDILIEADSANDADTTNLLENTPVIQQRRSSKSPSKEIKLKQVVNTQTVQQNMQSAFESKQDIRMLMSKMTQNKQNQLWSDSEDELCTVKDDVEEFSQQKHKTIFNLSPPTLHHHTSFNNLFKNKVPYVPDDTLKKTNNLDVLKVSSSRNRNKIPQFGTETQIISAKNNPKSKLKSINVTDETCLEPDSSFQWHMPHQQILNKVTKRKPEKIFIEPMTSIRKNSVENSDQKLLKFATPSDDFVMNEEAYFAKQSLLKSRGSSIKKEVQQQVPQFGITSTQVSPFKSSLKKSTPQKENTTIRNFTVPSVASAKNVFKEENPLEFKNFLIEQAILPEPVEGDAQLHQVVLSSKELDKFSHSKMTDFNDFQVQIVFVSDSFQDKLFFA